MLKKFITLILLVAILFNASGAEILAAEAGFSLSEKSSITDSEKTHTLLDSFGSKDRFKLFEPARYGFLSDENARLMLPDIDEENEEYFQIIFDNMIVGFIGIKRYDHYIYLYISSLPAFYIV